MRHARLLLLLLLSFTWLLSCKGKEESSTASNRPVIGVSLLTLTNPFFKELGNAVKEEAEKHGYDVILVAGEFDPARQQNQINDFIVKKVAAILLCPTDSKAMGAALTQANAAGIPIFTADIACTAEGVAIVSHVATDNYAAGRLAAQAMIEALNGSGKVGIIEHPEVESAQMRTRGFEAELAEQRAKNNVKIEIVSRLPGLGSKDQSFKAAEDMLQAQQDLSGIFAINDPTALGAVAAIEKAGKAGKIKIIAIDGQPEGRQAIKEGKVYADIMQHPEVIGKKSVEAIVKFMAGEKVEPVILIETNIYRQQDAMNDPTLR
ncbi:MAG: substrate-binding domain-containing protein [candidate division KSB1 bacterium]